MVQLWFVPLVAGLIFSNIHTHAAEQVLLFAIACGRHTAS
jgi:hypothetical protein